MHFCSSPFLKLSSTIMRWWFFYHNLFTIFFFTMVCSRRYAIVLIALMGLALCWCISYQSSPKDLQYIFLDVSSSFETNTKMKVGRCSINNLRDYIFSVHKIGWDIKQNPWRLASHFRPFSKSFLTAKLAQAHNFCKESAFPWLLDIEHGGHSWRLGCFRL